MEILRFADGAGPLADADAAATEAPLPEGWAGREALAAALALAGCGGGREDETALPTQGLPAPFAIRDQARTDAGLMPTRPSAASMQRLAASTTLRTPGPAELMDWAEAAYADYFPGHESDRVEEPYVYRHYTATGNYLGVADGQVYVLGTVSGGALLRVGSLADFAPRVYGEPRPIAAADADAARALLQAQFSALPHEIDAVRRRGFTAWLEEQMTAPRSITGVAWLDANGYRNTSVKRHYFTQERPAIWMIWPQLWLAPDAVRMRAALALSEFFVVSSLGASGNWVNYAMAAYWDLLVEHAFGSFRQLLEKLSENAAMGRMLSILGSRKEDDTGRRPDENYAREVMQLFTIGLYELNPDGTERLDSGGNRIETIDNDDVTNLARVFTGYVTNQNPGPALPTDDPVISQVPNPNFVAHPMTMISSFHSTHEVKFLGTTIPANTDPKVALGMALDTLFRHPNVGPFFSRQMIQRLVTSNPSPAYVERVARVFNDNGRGVRGDLKAVFRAIWLDPEARGEGSTRASRIGKLSEPMWRIVQWGRTFATAQTLSTYKGFEDAYGEQIPLRAATVFNFYRPGFVPPSTAMAREGWVVPEFQIVHETSTSGYLNHLQDLVRSGFNVIETDEIFDSQRNWVGSPSRRVPADYTAELPLAGNPAALVGHLNRVLCAGRLPAALQQLIIDAVASTPLPDPATEAQRRDRVAAAVLLVMAAPEYLVHT